MIWCWKRSHSVTSDSNLAKKRRKISEKIACFIGLCLVEFIISQIPLTIVLGLSGFESTVKSFKLQSTTAFISYCCWYTDCILNPLWVSLISLKKRRKMTATTTASTTTGYQSPILDHCTSELYSPSMENTV